MSLAVLESRKFQPEFALWALFVHLGALLLLPYYFSWGYLLFGFLLAGLTAYSMGIFHHMYLSHYSFQAHPIVENTGALLGTLSWRGPMAAPLRYVALHRIHHAYSDRKADPHSPVHGNFHALLGWNWYHSPAFSDPGQYMRWSGRHGNKPFLLFLDRNVHLLQLAWALLLFGLGGATALMDEGKFSFHRAMGWMAYGVFAKTLFVVYLANLVDVVNHRWGYRNYRTRDFSTNSVLMAMVHLGGAISWHNNHHAKPGYFTVKKKWWEFDVHHLWLKGLERIGLVSDLKVLDETRQTTSEDGTARLKLTDFLAQDKILAARMIGIRLSQFVLPSALFLALSQLGFSAATLAVALVVLAPLAAIGLHNLALLGHEGTHFNLSRDKVRSSLWGTFFSSLVPFHFNTGFALSHAAHHVWANTEKDPDLATFQPYESFLDRLIGARRAASLAYFQGTLTAAFGKKGSVNLPGLTANQLRFVARFNLVIALALLTVYGALAVFFPLGFGLFFLVSYSMAYLLSAVRPFLEHAGTDAEKYSNSRTFSSGLLDFAFGGINYHLAHHLYPRVPAYRMAEFQEWLEGQKEFQSYRKVTDSELTRLYQVASRLPYGRAEQKKPVAAG